MSDWTVVVTEVVDSVEESNDNAENAIRNPANANVCHTEEDQDSAFESDESRDSSDTDEGTNSNQPRHAHKSCKSAITTFLHPSTCSGPGLREARNSPLNPAECITTVLERMRRH
eukprot:TRINITY_DN36391_c0_g1_i1.p1 TRINITY_DN36391_c0_g1~~TRINITY_DN36391_c0_g1_i1.p1  ORF type:complete len:115 (-),score=28.07 TRINITY_DN36391_c0_g1_i1:123-467(-)